MICELFDHSPVYRIGGDEFTVILTGRDYENRHRLMRELHARSTAHISTQDTTQEAIVSGGMAEYVPGQDRQLHEVFERADSAMYEEKMLLKSLGAATRDDEAEHTEKTADYEQLLRKFLADLFIEEDTADKVTLRFGVFADARQEEDIERRFDSAILAAERARNDPEKICGFYAEPAD